MENIEKYLNKFYDFIDKIGKHNFVLIIFIFIALLTTTLYQTFSLYTESEGLSILDGIETYSFILNNSNDTDSVTIAAGNTKYIDITVSNETETKLKYGLYYSSNSDLTNVYIGYLNSTKYLPNGVIPSNSNYIVTLKVVNTSLSDITINFGLKYGFENGGDLPLNDGEYWLSEIIYGTLLSEVEEGSYVAYTGDSENGCDTTEVNGWTSCSGKNANYESEENKGWCFQSDYKFSVNGWRLAYVEDGSAHLISAGATDCMCTDEDGTPYSSGCSISLSVENMDKHFTNMNNIALNYCNKEYANNGVCIVNDSENDNNTVWAMNAVDFEKVAKKPLTSNSCYNSSQDETCGYNNDLIDNGGNYWFATPVHIDSNSAFVWHQSERLVSAHNSNMLYGVRPVLALDSSVIVVKGKGTYEEPYIISNPDYNPNEPEEPDVPSGTDLVNSPNLDNGNLIPVYYDDTAEVWKKADSTNKNNSWYDYENKKWANAVIIGDSTKKATYQSANPGTPVADSDITAFYVWIPRYKYRVWNITRQAGEESTYAYTAYSTGIEIQFEEGISSTGNVECTYDVTTEESETNLSDNCYYNGSSTPITTSDLNTNYTDAWYTHPAFTFGEEEKTGFWIGKFETTGNATTPTVLPDVSSLRAQTISEQFTTSKKFQNYLSNETDAHMLTNLEWGAVAYLTHSIYGLCNGTTCEGINHNNSEGYFTGRSGGAIASDEALFLTNVYPNDASDDDIEIFWNENGYYTYKGYFIDYNGNTTSTKDISKVASTTNNVTGVYDMSGGASEYVMGNMVDIDYQFDVSEAGDNWNGSNILNSKYYNSYSYGEFVAGKSAYNRSRLGDATAEVLGSNNYFNDTGDYANAWQIGNSITGSFSDFVYIDCFGNTCIESYTWFERGESFPYTSSGVFGFYGFEGGYDDNSFRSSLS